MVSREDGYITLDFDPNEPPESYCHDCGVQFDNSFELVDHTLEEDEEFDPYYILPNGMKLLLGSLLRFIYNHSKEPEQIELITQSTYITLFAAEMGFDMIDELVEDMVVKSAMQNLDQNIEKLLSKETDEEGGA
jgi:uncharacterized protein YjaG (DUF416 family)